MVFDINVTNALIIALMNLNITLAREGKENKTVNYSSFTEGDQNYVDTFFVKINWIIYHYKY